MTSSGTEESVDGNIELDPSRRTGRGTHLMSLVAVRPWAMLGLATLALVGFTALRQLDVGFSRMHVPGELSYDVGGLVGPSRLTLQGPSWDDAVEVWHDFETSQAVPLGPDGALRWHVVVDSALVMWTVGLFLGALAWRGCEQAKTLPTLRRWKTVTPAIQQVIALAVILAWALIAVDLIENVLILWASSVNEGGPLLWGLAVVSFAKWALVAGIVLPVLVTATAAHASRSQDLGRDAGIRDRWPSLHRLLALRAQVVAATIVVVLLVLPGDMGAQIVDVLLLWTERVWHIGWAAGLMLVTTAATVLGGRQALVWYDRRPRLTPMDQRKRWLVLGLAVVLGVLAWREWPWRGVRGLLVPPAVGLLVYWALSLPTKVRGISDDEGASAPTTASDSTTPLRAGALLPVLAALAGWVLGMLLARASIILLLDGSSWAAAFAFFAGIAAAAGWLGGLWGSRPVAPWKSSTRRLFASLVVLVAGLWVFGLISPFGVGYLLGTAGVVLLFSCLLGFVLLGLVKLSDTCAAKGPLALVGLARVPTVSLFLAWVFLTSSIDTGFRFHDARLKGPMDVQPASLVAAFDAWKTDAPTTGDVPLVFVASAGGGIRAAYWGALGMSCLFGQRPATEDPALAAAACPRLDNAGAPVFAASGISGGSVGLAMDKVAQGSNRALDAMDDDHLAPTLAQFLLFDLANSLLRFDDWPDRAEVLERSLERSWLRADQREWLIWDDKRTDASPFADGFFATQLQAGKPTFPLLFMNGATVDDGCRLNGSVLDGSVDPLPTAAAAPTDVTPLPDTSCTSLGPFAQPDQAFLTVPTIGDIDPDLARRANGSLARTKDLHDHTCDADRAQHDLRISTVAMISARFPFILPSAGLTDCRGSDGEVRRTFDVDGGALEVSATKPMEELWAALAPLVVAENAKRTDGSCIRPRLVIFDNGYRSTARLSADSRPLELLVPFQEKDISYDGATAAARQEAAIAFERFFAGICDAGKPPGSSVAFVYPTEQLGVQAPLGWTMSELAREDIREQLSSRWNTCQVKLVASWFGASTPSDVNNRCPHEP